MAEPVTSGDKVLALVSTVKPVEDARQLPYNIEAEQALIGAILLNNEAMNHVSDSLRAESFYHPIHRSIYSAIQKLNDRGHIANPVTLKHYFDQDSALGEIGGSEYLARLASAAVTIINVHDYSELICDLALKRELIGVGTDVVNVAFDPQSALDATEQIEAAEQKLFNMATFGLGESGFKSIRSGLKAAVERAENAFKNFGGVTGVTSGLSDLDKMLGGMQRSDLLILAGRPSMGKTALSTNIAYNAAVDFAREAERTGQAAKSVGFFSLEMSEDQLATRIISGAARVNSSRILKGDLNEDEFAKLAHTMNELSSLPFFIDETPALSISALRNRARRLKRTNNLGFLVVDYLQLVRSPSASSQANRVQEVSEITQGLKAIAKELEIPVMALSQLSRAVEQRDDKRPQLSDLRESGSIEQDADVVMFVFREEYYLSRSEPSPDAKNYQEWFEKFSKATGFADVIIAKHRNGPIGSVKLQFNGELTKFSDAVLPGHIPEQHY